MQPHFRSLCFSLWHTRMSQLDKEDSQNASLPFSSFCWLPLSHISRFTFPPTFTHRQKQTFYQPFLTTPYEKTQFKNFVHHRQQDLQLKCFSLLVSTVIIIHAQQLFRAVIPRSDWKQMCQYMRVSPQCIIISSGMLSVQTCISSFKYICFSRQCHRI